MDTKEREKVRIKRTPGGTKWKHVRAYRGVYLMTTPVLVAALIFYYLPMFGIRYAFLPGRRFIRNHRCRKKQKLYYRAYGHLP